MPSPSTPSRAELARMIDHTALRPDTTRTDVLTLCAEALAHDLGAVCVAPTWIPLAAERLAGAPQRIVSAIAFPHGTTLPAVKVFEAREALRAGADELDVVLNVGALRSGDDAAVADELHGVVAAAREASALVKVILETHLLTDREKARACELAEAAGADFVKTSTGFSGGGATVEDVRLLRRLVGERLGVKAAGGIRTLAQARALVAAGATRLGCSASLAVLRGHDEP